MTARAAVLGAGSWGTTFAAVLADAGSLVTLWGRDPDVVEQVARHRRNPAYLPGVTLPDSLLATGDAEAALAGADIVVLALPSSALRGALGRLAPALRRDALLVSLAKGIESGSNRRMSEVAAEAAGVGPERVTVVSGPNLAREIAARQPTASVVAGVDPVATGRVAGACATDYFRPYTNTDVVGVEVAGAMKNVIALAVGMASGLGYGDNCRASIVTRGLAETARLGVALGADPLTFAGLAGVGDLVATCGSPLSRNRSLGELVGGGLAVGEAVVRTGQTAEGVSSCRSLLALAASLGVDAPITAGVSRVVAKELPVGDLAATLLSRPLRAERH